MTLDRLGRPLRDLRISVTDRCNFRCVYCMPKEVFGARVPLPRPQGAADVRGDRAGRARRSSRSGVEKLRLTGGEPLVRKDVERLIAMLAPLGAELTLTTNASLLAAKAQALAAAGLHRVTVSLDSLDDATFRAMNDVDFPVSSGAGRDRGGGRRRAAGEGERGRQARPERATRSSRWPATSASAGHTLRFIEYMDVGATNGWRLDDVVPAAEIDRADLGGAAARAGRGELPRRGREALALRRRQRRDRRDRVGDAALLRRLHARADLGRGPALHLPLRPPRPRPARAGSAAAPPTRSCSGARRAIWGKRTDRYSELRSEATVEPAQGRDELHRRLTRAPPPGEGSDRRRGTIRRSMAASTATVAAPTPPARLGAPRASSSRSGSASTSPTSSPAASPTARASRRVRERRLDHRLPAQPRLDDRAARCQHAVEQLEPADPGDLAHVLALAVRRRRDRADLGLLQARTTASTASATC